MPNKPLLESAADTTRSAATHAAHTIEQLAETLAPLIAAAIANAKDHAAPYAASAKDKVVPLAESAKDKLAPLAESAMEHVTPLTDSAKEHVAPLAHQAKDKVTPLAESALEYVTPLAEHAREYVGHASEQARDYVGHAGEQIAPLAAVARDRGVEFATHTRESLEPAIHEASAYIQDDLLPKLNELLHQAADNPTVAEATHRGQAAFAALKGELVVPSAEVEKHSSPAVRLAKVLAVGAVIGGAIVAVRQLLASKDTGWTAHQPSAAYVNHGDDDVSVPESDAFLDETDLDVAEVDDAAIEDADAEVTEVADAPVEAHTELHHGDSHAPVDEEEAQALMTDEGAPVAPVAEETTAETAVAASPYGEGAYVGDEPPEEYTIKGNERSMKYHVAASGGYERTIADVWFASEEAAIAAGFSRAQR